MKRDKSLCLDSAVDTTGENGITRINLQNLKLHVVLPKMRSHF